MKESFDAYKELCSSRIAGDSQSHTRSTLEIDRAAGKQLTGRPSIDTIDTDWSTDGASEAAIAKVFAKVRRKNSISHIFQTFRRVREVESYALSKFQPPTTLGDHQNVEKTIQKKEIGLENQFLEKFPVLRTYRRPSLHMWLGVKGRRQAHRSATSDNQISKPTFPGGRGSRARHNVSCATALLQDILCLAPRPSDAHAWKLVDKSMQNLH